MKRLLLLSLLALSACIVKAQSIENATDAIKNMGLGWNLGNTLDANSQSVLDINSEAFWGGQGLESENCWGQKTTPQQLFPMLKNAGFGAVRIPVTWYNHMDKDGTVNAAWMARVHEIVDWAIEAGLYCIVNVHHDTGSDLDKNNNTVANHWLKADMKVYNEQKDRYEYLWRQIAEEFKSYDQHLLFESYNEMLDSYNSWCFASYATKSRYDAEVAADAYDAINHYAQSFVDVVRSTGGNNAERNLVVNTYSACCGGGTWNAHLNDPLEAMKLPDDKVQDHLIFEVHTYPNIASNSMANVKADIDKNIELLQTYLVSKGAPVIIGEWGTSNVDAGTDYIDRREKMLEFVDYFVKQMKANGMGTFYWMGLTDGFFREKLVFNQPDLVETLAKAYHGDSFSGEIAQIDVSDGLVVFEGEKTLAWGKGISSPADLYRIIGQNVKVEITYKFNPAENDDIQFYYGDWSDKLSFMVDGKTYKADFCPSRHYGVKEAGERTTIFSFNKTTADNLVRKGLLIHGVGVTVTKFKVSDQTASALDQIEISEGNEIYYNLSGQKVDGKSQRGLLIRNGKVIMKE